jgi:septal ring factor EnvC (AmiA/AmiB activator)
MRPLPEMPAADDPTGRLEQALQRVEQPLDALQGALQSGDLPALEQHAQALHAQLARAVDVFMRSGRHAPLPAPLRHRLASAGARVSALRDSLARTRTSAAHAIHVLMPAEAAKAATYSADGAASPRGSGGFAQA